MKLPALPEAAALPRRASPGGFLGSLGILIAGNSAFRREYRLLRRTVHSSEALRAKAPRILPLLKRLARERMWLERYRELRSLMGSWRFFHRWLALLMLAVVLCHVVIAFMFGDLWVLRGSW